MKIKWYPILAYAGLGKIGPERCFVCAEDATHSVVGLTMDEHFWQVAAKQFPDDSWHQATSALFDIGICHDHLDSILLLELM